MRYILTFILLINGLLRVSGQSASFIMSESVKCGDSLYVNFTNTSIQAGIAKVNFSWEFGNGQSSKETSPSNILFVKPNYYTVILTMTNAENTSESYKDTSIVILRPRPNANFFIADSFNLGLLTYRFLSGRVPIDSMKFRFEWTLNPKNDGTYDFQKVDTIQNKGIRDLLTYQFNSVGPNYMRLKVSDYFGCPADHLTQRFVVSEKLVVPKAFTPNGDNLNDFFIVPTNGRTLYSLQIFSMSGHLIFKSESKSIIWDGNFSNGSKAAPGTYLYIIEPLAVASPEKISGFVMLLRQYDK